MPASNAAPRQARLLTFASLAIVVAALYFAKEVLIPLALAIMLSFLLGPLVIRLQRWGLGRIPAVIAVVTVVLLAIASLGWVVYGQLMDLADRLPQYQQNIEEKVTWGRRFTSGGPLEKAAEVLEKTIEKASTQPSQPDSPDPATRPAGVIVPRGSGQQELIPPDTDSKPLPVFVTNQPVQRTNVFANFIVSLAPLLGPLGMLGIIAVFVIFMLIEREDLRDRIIRLIGQGRINLTTQAMDEAAQRVSRFLIAQCIVNGTYGLAIGLGLWIIGVTVGGSNPSFPNALLWGLLTAILRFIPYIGPWIGAAPPLIISLAVYPGMGVPLSVIGMFLVIELLSNNVMEPWLYGASAGVSAVAILVAAVFWTWLWGTAGLLLSTPLTVLIVVIGKYVPQFQFLNVLLGDEPALEPHYRFYQRLLAQDTEEAEDLLAEQAADGSLERVYDTIVLPALGLAEADWHRGRLDEWRRASVRRQIGDIVEDLPDLPMEAEPGGTSVRVVKSKEKEQSANGLAGAVESSANVPKEETALRYDRNILCLPARDEADELAAMMLAQVLKRKGYAGAQFVSVASLASEYVETMQRHDAEVVFVSALPPAAVTHAKYVVKRLRAARPGLKIIVGVWTAGDQRKKAHQRLDAVGADALVFGLDEAIEALRQVVAPMVLTGQVGDGK